MFGFPRSRFSIVATSIHDQQSLADTKLEYLRFVYTIAKSMVGEQSLANTKLEYLGFVYHC